MKDKNFYQFIQIISILAGLLILYNSFGLIDDTTLFRFHLFSLLCFFNSINCVILRKITEIQEKLGDD